MNSPAFKILWRLIVYPAALPAVFSLIALYVYAHPRRYISEVKPPVFETVKFTASDGVRLAGWFIPNKNSKKAVIICHGYPMDKGDVYGMSSFLAKNFNLLLFDFRAMGESGGFFSTGGAKETMDIDAAVAFLAAKGFRTAGGFGFSMGASAILMSANPALTARVADAPYADLVEQLAYIFKGYGALGRPLIRMMNCWSVLLLGVNMDEVSPLRRAAELTGPLLLIHGDTDSHVPVRASLALKAADPGAELWIIKNAGHGATRIAAGSAYEKKVTGFFEKNI